MTTMSAQQARLLRSQAMTAGTTQAQSGSIAGYDVVDLGYNYRMDEPRAALLVSRFRRLPREIARRRELTDYYRARLAPLDLLVPFADEQVEVSSAYSMSVLMPEPGRRDEVRIGLGERGVQTTTMYTGVHEFSAYRSRFPGVSLPNTERASQTQFNLPLFPHLTEPDIDRVVSTVEELL